MKRDLDFGQRRGRPSKLQRSIRSMFVKSGPKFVEAVGLQLTCRYCARKFKAPQGLVSHIHMHEQAGDAIMHEEVKVVHADIPSQLRALPIEEEIKAHAESKEIIQNEVVLAPGRWSMTRRFTVAEKLKIIEKYKETENTSATCR